MKKVYMTPTTKWVEAQTEEMIAGSDMFTESGGNLIQDLSSAPELNGETTSGNLSRQSLWDEE